MILIDLFESYDEEDEMDIRTYIMDVLVPVYETGIDKVSVKSVVEKLDQMDLPVPVTSDSLYDLLGANNIAFIKKVDSNFIYFNIDPARFGTESDDAEQERQQQKVKSMAQKHIDKQK